MECDEPQVYPSAGAIDFSSSNRRVEEQTDRDDHEHYRNEHEVFVRNLVDHDDHEKPGQQESKLMEHFCPMSSILVCQLARGTIHLHHGDEAQEEINHPDALVAREQVAFDDT